MSKNGMYEIPECLFGETLLQKYKNIDNHDKQRNSTCPNMRLFTVLHAAWFISYFTSNAHENSSKILSHLYQSAQIYQA